MIVKVDARARMALHVRIAHTVLVVRAVAIHGLHCTVVFSMKRRVKFCWIGLKKP